MTNSGTLDTLGLITLTLWDLLLVLTILLAAHALILATRWTIRRAAEQAAPRWRLTIFRVIPILRLVIWAGAIAIIVPILVEPTFRNIVAVVASLGLALAFALKDYGSSLIAGVVTVLENTYQPGDWIEIDGVYGEVVAIGARAVRLVTADDTEVTVPHTKLCGASIHNATSGNHNLLCIVNFYLHPDHAAAAARGRLIEIAEGSPYRQPDKGVVVIVKDKPWGTLYRVKLYARESRDQFQLITDVTIRGKEALRAMNLRFAQAFYAVSEPG